MWKVILDKKGPVSMWVFKPEHFPREFKYKKDALDLIDDVKSVGGKAHLEKENIVWFLKGGD
jgi:hypothetical protein